MIYEKARKQQVLIDVNILIAERKLPYLEIGIKESNVYTAAVMWGHLLTQGFTRQSMEQQRVATNLKYFL